MEILQPCGLCSSMEQPSWAKGFPYTEPGPFFVSDASFLLCSSFPAGRARILTAPTSALAHTTTPPILSTPLSCCSLWGSHHIHDIFLSWEPRPRCRIQMWFPECEWALMPSGCLNPSPVLRPGARWAVQADTSLCWPAGTVARFGSAWSLGLSVLCPPLGHSALHSLRSLGFWLCSASSSLRETSIWGCWDCTYTLCVLKPRGSACARAVSLAGSRSLPACSKSHRAPWPQGKHPGAAYAACLVLLARCPAPWGHGTVMAWYLDEDKDTTTPD